MRRYWQDWEKRYSSHIKRDIHQCFTQICFSRGISTINKHFAYNIISNTLCIKLVTSCFIELDLDGFFKILIIANFKFLQHDCITFL